MDFSLMVDCTVQMFRSNNKQDRDTFVKNMNAGDGNSSNKSTGTKITHILSPKLMKLT